MRLRLDKYLADMGLGTRTEIKEFIKKGFVTWNGEIIKKPEQKVDTQKDRVFYYGTEIKYHEKEYYMINKPAGVLTATKDNRQKTVLDFFDYSIRKDLFPVGRLDKDTEGLLFITNDGALAHKLLSPKNHIPKRYFVIVSGMISQQDIHAFAGGLFIPAYEKEKQKIEEDRFAAFQAMPAEMKLLFFDREKKQSHVEIQIYEGKFHQIKRMCQAISKPVIYLKRISMGNLELDDSLKPGEYRALTEEEISNVKK